MKGKEFRLQLEEAMDSNKDVHLICYVWCVDGNKIVEDLLFCKSITDLFEILGTFMVENNLEYTVCFDICTDGGCCMSSYYAGLQALIQSKVLGAQSIGPIA